MFMTGTVAKVYANRRGGYTHQLDVEPESGQIQVRKITLRTPWFTFI
jgi:ribosomal protein L17